MDKQERDLDRASFELCTDLFTIFLKNEDLVSLLLIGIIWIVNFNVSKGKVAASIRTLDGTLPLARTGPIGHTDNIAHLEIVVNFLKNYKKWKFERFSHL